MFDCCFVEEQNKDAEGEENTNLEAAVEKYSAVQCRVSFGGGACYIIFDLYCSVCMLR